MVEFAAFAQTVLEILELEGIILPKKNKTNFINGNKDIYFSELDVDFDSMLQVEIAAVLESKYKCDGLLQGLTECSSFYQLFKISFLKNIPDRDIKITHKSKAGIHTKPSRNDIKKHDWHLQLLQQHSSLTSLRSALKQVENVITPTEIEHLYCMYYGKKISSISATKFVNRRTLRLHKRAFGTGDLLYCKSLLPNFKSTPKGKNYPSDLKSDYQNWLTQNAYVISKSPLNASPRSQFIVKNEHDEYIEISDDQNINKRSKTLLICFTGSKLRMMSTLPWFLCNLNPDIFEILLLKYPTSRSGYQDGLSSITLGLPGLIDFLISYSTVFKNVHTLGTSGGGLAALLFGTLFKNGGSISASGHTHLDTRWKDKLNLFDVNLINQKSNLYLYGRGCRKDLLKARIFARNFPKLRVLEVRRDNPPTILTGFTFTKRYGLVGHNSFLPIIQSYGLMQLINMIYTE